MTSYYVTKENFLLNNNLPHLQPTSLIVFVHLIILIHISSSLTYDIFCSPVKSVPHKTVLFYLSFISIIVLYLFILKSAFITVKPLSQLDYKCVRSAATVDELRYC